VRVDDKVKAWLAIADDDLDTAKSLLNGKNTGT
jgi:hypothetical protein